MGLEDRLLPKGRVQRPALVFLRLLWQIHHGLQAASKQMERAIGVTGPQRLVLRLLAERPGMTASELAELLHLDPSTLTGIVRRLERGGLVRRAADPLDGRRFLLAPTLRARAVISRPGTIEERVEAALGVLSTDAVEGAGATLALVAAGLHSVPAPANGSRAPRRKRGRRASR